MHDRASAPAWPEGFHVPALGHKSAVERYRAMYEAWRSGKCVSCIAIEFNVTTNRIYALVRQAHPVLVRHAARQRADNHPTPACT